MLTSRYQYFISVRPSPIAVPDIREALNATLRLDPLITSYSGSRVRPGMFSQKDALPGITFSVVTNPRLYHLDGYAGVANARVQLDFWARDLNDCVRLKNRAEVIMDGFALGGNMQGLDVMTCTQDAEVDLHESPADGSDRTLYHIAVDYLIAHRV